MQDRSTSIELPPGLPDRAIRRLRALMRSEERILWCGQPARLNKKPIYLMSISVLIVILLQIPVIQNEPQDLPLILASLLIVLSLAGTLLFFMIRGQFRNTWYIITSHHAVAYIPMLVRWGNAYPYPISQTSTIEMKQRGDVGDVTIKSPEFYKNPDKPGGFIRFSNVADPEDVKYHIAWAIAEMRRNGY